MVSSGIHFSLCFLLVYQCMVSALPGKINESLFHVLNVNNIQVPAKDFILTREIDLGNVILTKATT